MRVRITACQVALRGVGAWKRGDEPELTDDEARALIGSRMAEPITTKAEPPPEPDPEEAEGEE